MVITTTIIHITTAITAMAMGAFSIT